MVDDGKFITPAGVSAGIDMALQLVSRVTDEATSRYVQMGIEYDPRPPFGGIEWDNVDQDKSSSLVLQNVREQLSGSPELQARLLEAETVDGRSSDRKRRQGSDHVQPPREFRRSYHRGRPGQLRHGTFVAPNSRRPSLLVRRFLQEHGQSKDLTAD
jgi:hypothetical protein